MHGIVALFLLFGVPTVMSASSQSLAEVAKNERERREQNQADGKSAVVSVKETGEAPENVAPGPSEAQGADSSDPTPPEATEPATERERPPTRKERSARIEARMDAVDKLYRSALARCHPTGTATASSGELVTVALPGDPLACDEMAELEAEWEDLYAELWRVDRQKVLFDHIPKSVVDAGRER